VLAGAGGTSGVVVDVIGRDAVDTRSPDVHPASVAAATTTPTAAALTRDLSLKRHSGPGELVAMHPSKRGDISNATPD
jgi:hypothetical protein